MARYYRVSPKFWTDHKVRSWSEDGRTLGLYLLTCPHRSTEGLFRLPAEYVRADLSWPQKRYVKARDELVVSEFVDVEGDVVLLMKALKYQAPQNPNQVKGAIAALEEVPSTRLDGLFLRSAQRFSERLAEALPQLLPERFGESLALTQPQPSSPSSTVDDDKERIAHFTTQGYDLTHVRAMLARYDLRCKGFGKPVSDLDAWGRKVLDDMAKAEANALDSEPVRALIDGETWEQTDEGWRVVA